MGMAKRKKITWWMIIRNDSWMDDTHGAFDLSFVIKTRHLDSRNHVHTNTVSTG
jgi:hypothetical protein